MPKLFLTEARLNRLLDLSRANPRDHALLEVAVSAGLRVSDLVRIRISDVSENGTVLPVLKMRMQKTGKVVERKLRNSCQIAIAEYLASRKNNVNPFLFCSESNNCVQRWTSLNRSSIHRVFKKYLAMVCKSAELRGNSCHTTRRSVAQLISEKTGSIVSASKWLGHKSLSATTAYLDGDSAGVLADEVVSGLFC